MLHTLGLAIKTGEELFVLGFVCETWKMMALSDVL